MPELRPYQSAAVNAFWSAIRHRKDNPCIVLPTAAGKTLVMGQICQDALQKWNGRVLILAHVKELLEQTASELVEFGLGEHVGIYSAGLKRRDKASQILVAGIQSVSKRAFELGKFDIVLIDECHLLPASGEGQYRTFISEAKQVNPLVRIGGLTATPYRLDVGLICAEEHVLNHVCYEVILGPVVKEVVERTADRHSVLMFTTGLAHARAVVEELGRLGQQAKLVIGSTPNGERDTTITEFKDQRLKYLVNCNVLTTGFNAKCTDAVILMRATLSPGLYYQIVGRGFRLHPSKENCLILDYGQNILRHGPVDNIAIDHLGKPTGAAPVRQCPECDELIPLAATICPACNAELPKADREIKHAATASKASPISTTTEDWLTVTSVSYNVHEKRSDPDAPKTMKVTYHITLLLSYSEWVCVEHEGFAHNKALGWWFQRTKFRIPKTAEDAVFFANQGLLKEPTEIQVKIKTGDKFPAITGFKLDPTPIVIDKDALLEVGLITFKGDELNWMRAGEMEITTVGDANEDGADLVMQSVNLEDVPF